MTYLPPHLPLTALQHAFARALTQPEMPVPADIRGGDERAPKKRFNVYRNNMFASLITVLAGRFPAVERLVGEEFFRALASAFIRAHPPRDPVIIRYGAAFPAFLEGFEPVADTPYLPDVARLEMAWNTAYHAADARPLTAEELADLPPEHIARLVLRVHPALGVLRSPFPVLSIWEKNIPGGDGKMAEVDFAGGGEDVLILRPERQVHVLPLRGAAYPFIRALERRAPLGQAVDAAMVEDPTFDFPATLALLIQNGAFCGFHIQEGEGDTEA